MLLIRISNTEIRRLSYERYYSPCPIVQKRIFAIYLKATTKSSNKEIGRIVGLAEDSVSHWIKVDQENGVDFLYRYNYGTNKTALEPHSSSILESFIVHGCSSFYLTNKPFYYVELDEDLPVTDILTGYSAPIDREGTQKHNKIFLASSVELSETFKITSPKELSFHTI
ncbi:MAG: hypothetical protein K9H64_23410 [Bacteroidales bacterium]|nr:hypothetical protein [Bacteroidales bacterium]MCF8458984.1 hypothetical protein [Bacteroidales bacterium]